LKGVNGGFSGKRIAGFILVVGVIAIGIFGVVKDPSQASTILWPICTTAGACFGATVFEKKV
jgi:hypothetical protein